ncbi:MAG: bifunctional 3,4-dihydroxy-2-butanone-4-phosphate synthase/GTP cyclohydrolase II [Planctomycetota bacterium]|nr:bifunctional 3,4-dihydroxy-2-butanone-4-phosphate synthase/GTP cyclohydrolase II [Planctomycetota bacterium]
MKYFGPNPRQQEVVLSMDPIKQILQELRAGRMFVLLDDESRENEGDLVCAAEKVTAEAINFMAKFGRGLICVPMLPGRADELALHPQTADNDALHGTAFTVSVDAAAGVSTGISAADRARTVQLLANDNTSPGDLVRPGHVFPLRARDGGVLVRAGQTEGAVDLCRLAGLKPVGVICEIMKEDGTMARRADLEAFCKTHALKMCSVADVIRYRLRSERLIERAVEIDLPLEAATFRMITYSSLVDPEPHIALCLGGIGELDKAGKPVIRDEPVLVRVHSECLTGDAFGSLRCDCGPQLQTALRAIATQGAGALVYVRQEGRGIGLINKLRAYKLQIEQGLDTVEANLHLGFEPDRRDYGIGSQILRDLGLTKLRIMTNNPRKIYGLEGFGLEIVERVPLQIPAHDQNRHYLKTKKDKLGHMLENL